LTSLCSSVVLKIAWMIDCDTIMIHWLDQLKDATLQLEVCRLTLLSFALLGLFLSSAFWYFILALLLPLLVFLLFLFLFLWDNSFLGLCVPYLLQSNIHMMNLWAVFRLGRSFWYIWFVTFRSPFSLGLIDFNLIKLLIWRHAIVCLGQLFNCNEIVLLLL